MSAIPKSFSGKNARISGQSVASLPNSHKIYIAGSRMDIRVPMREISLSDTPTQLGAEKNPPLAVYDTSGPYTDPDITIDIRKGLPALRQDWIEERNDTEQLPDFTSEYGRRRMQDPDLRNLRYECSRLPRCARSGKNVTQMHYARQGHDYS
jgi:phosphomethylpyrimidine synthase